MSARGVSTVWKFPLLVTDRQTFSMTQGVEMLSVHTQHGQHCLWARLDPAAAPLLVRVRIIGTGHLIHEDDERLTFIGTLFDDGGALVWHVFREIEA